MGEKDWIMIYSAQLQKQMITAPIYIGVSGNWGEMQIYNWKYMNYLQLYYTEKKHFVGLDYYLYPNKNNSFNHTQQFLDITNVPLSEFCELHGSVAEGVLWYLKHGYYVELTLDEYYIPERSVTGIRHRNHNNLLYGYGNNETEFYALGYKDKVRVAAVEKDIINSYIKENSTINIYKYCPNNVIIDFNMERFLELLRNFVNGDSTGVEYANILPEENYVYGLKVFEVLLHEKSAKDYFQHDQRGAYLIWEHAKIMRERLEFLYYRNYISCTEFGRLYLLCSEMVNNVEKLKNLVLKNKVKEKYDKQILVRLEEVYRREREFYQTLLKILEDRYSK